MSQAWSSILVRVLVTLLLAAGAWVVLGFLATAPLGAIYGWSGHPSIPAAPIWVYYTLYLAVLPVVCVGGAWMLVGAVARLLGRRG
jgi:hypothetical protein